MPSFTDSDGRNWDLDISLSDAKRIEIVDFSAVYDGDVSLLEPPQDLFQAVLNRVPLQFALVYWLCKPQADALGVNEEQFCDAINGQCLLQGKQALWEALTDFFPALKTSLARLFAIHSDSLQRIDQKLAGVADRLRKVSDSQIDQAIADVEAEIGSTLSRGSQQSAASSTTAS